MYQPLEDVLYYPDFSLTLPIRDIPQMLEILEAVPHEQRLQYRRNL